MKAHDGLDTAPIAFPPLTIAGLDELDELYGTVSHTVSLLDPGIELPAGLDRLGHRWHRLLRFHDEVEDFGPRPGPRRGDIEALMNAGDELSRQTVERLLVHCHMGVSRSTVAAAILMARANPGREEAVFAEIARIRQPAWPNSRMLKLADEVSGGATRLAEAAKDLYADTAAAFPDFAEALRASPRGHEVPGG